MEKEKKHIGLYRHIKGEKPSDEDMAALLNTTARNAIEVQDFYRHQCRHIWDVQVKPYVIWGTQSTYPPLFASGDRKRYTEEYGLGGFEPNYHHTWGGMRDGICGQAGVPGTTGVTYSPASCGSRTMCHELGHNFGLMHSNAKNADGSVSEYGDHTTIMGSKYRKAGFNSPQRVFFGIDGEDTIVRPTETGQYLLCPIEMSKHSMHSNEVKHIVISKRGFDDFYVSIRKGGYGCHYAGGDGGLLVNSVTYRNASVAHDYAFENGASHVLPNGVKVELVDWANETAKVNIYMDENDPAPDDTPMPTGFPSHMPTVELAPIHSGSWYNKDMNGQGFDLQIKDNRLAFYWYTFNKNNHARRFYYGSCPVGAGLEEFDVYTTVEGTWDDPTQAKEKLAGKGQLFFYDDGHGIFNYNFREGDGHDRKYDNFGRGSIEITPIAKSVHPQNGVFYQPSRNMEGFTVQFFNDMQLCVSYWYTYGPHPIGGGSGGVQTQRWFACVGNKNLNGTYDMKIYEVLNGYWTFIKEETDEIDVGSAILEIVDTNNITFTYDIDADNRVKGQGVYNLMRLL